MSLRDQLAGFVNRRTKTIKIPGIEGPIVIQSITELERTEILQRSNNGHQGHTNALLIAASLVNENGRRIYSDSSEDINEILQLDSRITMALAEAINEHVSPAGLEETVKNSETIQSDASLSN